MKIFLNIIVTIFLLIFSVSGIRLETVSSQTVSRHNNELSKRYDTTNNDNNKNSNDHRKSHISPMDLRSIDDWKLSDHLLISDIDGNLHGVERNSGALLWTLPMDDPLVKITTNATSTAGSRPTSTAPYSDFVNENSESNILWFVEPYQDGSLYYFTPKFGLNKLPTSIKNLVLESPFSLNGDDKVYTGSRKTSLYTINIHTGEIVSSFGNKENCPIPNSHYDKNFNNIKNDDTIMIGKTIYELSIFSKENTNVVWNVTYSQWGPNNIDNDLMMQNQQSLDELYFTPFHDKSLLAINKNLGTPVWISKLPSLAVNVFDIFNNIKQFSDHVVLPHPLKVLNNLQINGDSSLNSENSDLCFLNRTSNGKEWFAMSYINYPTLIKSAPVSKYQSNLYKLAHNLPTDISVEFLSNFKLSQTETVENMISGIHKSYHLTSETMFQPLSRFDDISSLKQISDGKPHHNDDQDITFSAEEVKPGGPDVMNGINFQNEISKEANNQDISTIISSNNHDLLIYDEDDDSKKQVARNPSFASHQAIESSLSLIKRICEDVIVILVLLLFLMFFGKFGKLSKKARKLLNLSVTATSTPTTPNPSTDEAFESKDFETSISEEAFGSAHYEKDLDSTPKEEENTDLEYRLTDILNGKSESSEIGESSGSNEQGLTSTTSVSSADISIPVKSIKKVTVISPDQSLEEPEERDIDTGDKNSEKAVDSDDNDGEQENDGITTKKKRKRGARGGKRGGKGKKKNAGEETEADENEEVIATKSLVQAVKLPSTHKIPLKKLQIENNLVISDKILGYGSHGTVVYQGTFENRPVAVKRMLLDFYDVASHEVRLLQESDDHPNVIRYFCSQSSESEKFLYIALELCICSLEDIIEKCRSYPKNLRLNSSNINNVLFQLVSGLNYLHSLKIVHRDIKPQNILVGDSTKKTSKNIKTDASEQASSIRLLISDFGLCKKLDSDQSSFRATTQHAASGTSGWRAPELLLHHDLLEISPDTISSIGSSSRHSITNGNGSSGGGKRLTKAIDIFSLGCVFFYILSEGNHPFGDRYLREGNIIKGESDLSILKHFCADDSVEATDLISSMIHFNPKLRPDTLSIMKHPFFWGMNKKLEFLLKVSDRFEVEKRDPPSDLLLKLEEVADKVHNGDWHCKFDDEFMNNLGKYRKYNKEKLMDLLRALRNKYHHFNDMPSSLQEKMSPLPHGFYKYFNDKFPDMLMEIYSVVEENLKHEHLFTEFY